jgi:hypothetical protein
MEVKTKLKSGRFMYPATLSYEGDRIFVMFPYNKGLIEQIKSFEEARYHGFDEKNPRKCWSILCSARNLFQLSFLQGQNPYKNYEAELLPVTSSRPMRKHQLHMKQHMLTRHYAVIIGEMGTGKTLPAIEVMEDSGIKDWWYIAPTSGVVSLQIELATWSAKVFPQVLMTYDELRKIMSTASASFIPPHGVIFDESSRIKTPTAQRSQAAMMLADAIRMKWGPEGYVILMTGSPAPKNPGDFWHQCEVACPGFLKEGTLAKFKQRLSLSVMKESLAGGVYPEHITWLDDATKCNICGKHKDDGPHTDIDLAINNGHPFVPSVNEVEKLYRRMRGLALVYFKKDCLDLPDKQYRVIHCEPSESTLRVAQVIKDTSARVIESLTLLRELSDGFQYQDVQDGESTCDVCKGTGKTKEWYDPADPDSAVIPEPSADVQLQQRPCDCRACNATGKVPRYERRAIEVPSPKVNALLQVLDEHDDVGRLVVYAAFMGSIDRCVNTILKEGWEVIRIDSRGWMFSADSGISKQDMILAFQKKRGDYEKIAIVAQPGSGGMGLTLTASPSILYYSNDFNAENRIQSEDRIHRNGMDTNRGATIIDLIHLPTDQLVLDNLKKKRDLQSLSLNELKQVNTGVRDE